MFLVKVVGNHEMYYTTWFFDDDESHGIESEKKKTKKQIQENLAKKSSFTFNQTPKESKLPNLPEGFRVCHFLLFPRVKKSPGSARVCFPGGVPFLLSAGRHGFWMISKALKVNKSCKKRWFLGSQGYVSFREGYYIY